MEGDIQMKTTIPFDGFYNSIHNDQLDWAFESTLQDENGEPTFLINHADMKWGPIFESYARSYVKNFAQEFNIPSLKYELLDSPREYNFATDRIFCTITQKDARCLLSGNREALRQVAIDKLTACSGFIPYYDSDISTWGDLRTWDHNQVGLLIEAAAGNFDQFDLMEGEYLDNWIWENMKNADRIGKVYDWLRARNI